VIALAKPLWSIDYVRSKLSPQGWYSRSLSHRAADQFERYLETYLGDERIIYDRAHFSEIVYEKLWRGHTGLTTWQKHFLDDLVLESFVVILAQASRGTLIQRYRECHQAQAIDALELEKCYNKLISRSRYKIERVFGSIKRWFGGLTARYVGLDPQPACVGGPSVQLI